MKWLPLVGTILAVTALAVAAQQDTPEKLRTRIAAETNLVNKARLEIRLADTTLDQARKQYAGDDFEQGEASVKSTMMLAEQAYADLFATHRDPRSKPAGFKEAEIKMREFARRLQDIRQSLPVDDRAPLDKAITRMRDMQDDLLHGLMRVKKEERP